MDNKELMIIQNRKYIVELANSLNKHLKGLTKKELHDLNDVDTIVRNLIAPEYWSRFGVVNENRPDGYNYLSGLSYKAYWFIVSRVQEGRANIYHSVESYLGAQQTLHRLQSVEREQNIYFSKNKVKHDFKEADRQTVYEIVSFVYEKLKGNT